MAWGSQGAVFLGDDLMHSRDYSDETARVIDEEVERILREQEERCRDTLTEHRNGLDLVARALLEHETIDGSEVYRLVALGREGRTAIEEFGEWRASDGRGEGSGAFSDEAAGARHLRHQARVARSSLASGRTRPGCSPARAPRRPRPTGRSRSPDRGSSRPPRPRRRPRGWWGRRRSRSGRGAPGRAVLELLHATASLASGWARSHTPWHVSHVADVNTATSHGASGRSKSARSTCAGTAYPVRTGASRPLAALHHGGEADGHDGQDDGEEEALHQLRASKTRWRHGGRLAASGSGVLAEADDDGVEGGADGHRLALVAGGAEGAPLGVELVDPPVGAVERRRRSGRPSAPPAVVDPALGEDPLPVPHAVAEVQRAEAGPVLGGGVDERRADERAGGVDAGVGRAHADRVQHAVEQEPAHGVTRSRPSRPTMAATMFDVPDE